MAVRVFYAALLVIALVPADAAADDSNDNATPKPPAFPWGANDASRENRSTGSLDPSKPIPPGFHVEEQPPSSLILVGGVIFGVSHGLVFFEGAKAVLAGSSYKGCPANGWLMLPVGGPFIVADKQGGERSPCRNPEGIASGMYTLDGLIQVIGAGLLVAGLGAPRQVVVKDAAKSNWQVVPWHVGASSAGVNLIGTF